MTLSEALLKVQSAAAKVHRDGANPHTNRNYPTLEAVLDVLSEPLQENGILVKQFTAFADAQWVLRTEVSIGATDKEVFDLPLLGLEEAKNKMQAIGSAVTYARRYALMAFFKLAPTDDDAEALNFVPEKKPAVPAKSAPKNHAPQAKDMKIPDGKFKGKMLSSIPREELVAYIEEIVQAMETSGRKPPKWFEEVRKVSGL